MAICSLSLNKFPSLFPNLPSLSRHFPSSPYKNQLSISYKPLASYRFPPGRRSIEEEEEEDNDSVNGSNSKFTEAVALFNSRDYHGCHDYLEEIWNDSEDPIRYLVHGILQCSVGFHHLFNQNHKGAMMEIGEGLCKLRKLNFDTGPFHQFERDMSAVLDFIYQTQLEFAACNDDMCIAMDQSETSYKLLGGYGAGQHLYWLEMDGSASLYIVFCPDRSVTGDHQPRVRLPILYASQEHLMELEQS
ncbi:putative TTHA0068-like superfamily protein [Helianthus annuus]|nr:putative TTHA0068-like superfamily protein [Helianthus annuus]